MRYAEKVINQLNALGRAGFEECNFLEERPDYATLLIEGRKKLILALERDKFLFEF